MTRVRTGLFEAADTVAQRILTENSFPDVFEFLYVDPDDVTETFETFSRDHDQNLSHTDATSVHLYAARGIDAVLTFDGFDSLVDYIEP